MSRQFKPLPPSIRTAESLDWCHTFGGAVHSASWERTNQCLTTLTEDENGDRVCFEQSPGVPLEDLRTWGSRVVVARQYGVKVCKQCEDRFDDMENLRGLNG